MGKKGGKAPEVKETAAEKANAAVSKAKFDRYKSLYHPVEREFIEETDKDVGSTLRGRALADVSQAADGSMKSAVTSGYGGASNTLGMASSIAGARSAAAADATTNAQQIEDKSKLHALAIGHDLAADAGTGLAAAARASNQEAIGLARAATQDNIGKQQMMQQLGGMAAGAFYKTKGFGMFNEDSDGKWSMKK